MNTKTKKIVSWSVFSGIIIALIVLGSIFDLQISKAIADLPTNAYLSKNIFAILGETFGENILYILLVISLGILYFFLLKKPLKNKIINYGLLITFAIASFVISFYCINKTLGYIAEHTSFGLNEYISSTLGIVVIILMSIIVEICAFFLMSKISLQNLENLWKWALLVIVVSAISNGIVQGAKHIFDRTRYRAMVYVGDTEFTFFTNWFEINNNKFNSISAFAEDFFKSFPSGHTCAAASSFLLVLLPQFFPQTNNKKWKSIFWIFATIYTVLVGLSRIISGAHFFTDVLFGGLVTFVCVLLAKLFINKFLTKQTKNFDQDKK